MLVLKENLLYFNKLKRKYRFLIFLILSFIIKINLAITSVNIFYSFNHLYFFNFLFSFVGT